MLAIERGMLPGPQASEKWMVFNAHPLPAALTDLADFRFEQGFRPTFLDLAALDQDVPDPGAGGTRVVPVFGPEMACDHSVIFAGRVRAVNEANFGRAWQATKTGGTILVSGDKTAGITSLRRWVDEQAGIADSFSKHHAVCFWCVKNEARQPSLPADTAGGTGPVFSSGEPDRGSQILAEHFSARISGKVADFGAGEGYLTRRLLAASGRVTSVDLIEAEWNALELARASLGGAQAPLAFHWIDILREYRKKPLDWVIMNPPFHHGLHGERKPDPDLGRNFIAIAASTLVQGGRLIMVANRNLAYERTLENAFRRFVVLEECDGYKVIEATR